MRAECPSCGAFVPGRDVDLSTLAARCRACEEVFRVQGLDAPRAAAPARPPLPPGLTVERREASAQAVGYRTGPAVGELLVGRRWWRWSLLLFVPFLVVWFGFLAVWFAGSWEGPRLMALCALPHVAAGLGLAYFVLAHAVNRTRLRVADGVLSVAHGPLPWRGDATVETAAIRQLYVRKTIHRQSKGTNITWGVHAQLEDRSHLRLLTGLPDQAQADYLEWVVEQHLGIVDDPSMSES